MDEIADAVRCWDPPVEIAHDTLRRWPADAFAALLDQPPPPDADLPPLWHWLFFLDHPRSAELGLDGHVADGHLLPPIPRRRRMIAGGRLEFRRLLRFGSAVRRTSRVTAVTPKTGRSGAMLFVTERREYADDPDGTDVAVVEDLDVVYRQAPGDAPPLPPAQSEPPDPVPHPVPEGQVGLVPDAPLLFRFSALTYNAHRIHHDEAYARGVEGYPGLVVHGPLLALLLLEPARRAGRAGDVAAFEFRLRRPAFAGTPVAVQVDGTALAAGPVGGDAAVTGALTWR